MAGINLGGTLGGIGLGITQGMYDRNADAYYRTQKLQLDNAKTEAEADKSVRESLKRATDARKGVQRAAPTGTDPAASADAASLTPAAGAQPSSASAAPAAGPSPTGMPAATPAAQSSIGPSAGPATGAAVPATAAQPARPTFDPDLQLEQAQIMIESGHPRYIQMGQQLADNALKLKASRRTDEQQSAIYGSLQTQNQLINSFHDPKEGTQHATDFLLGPGQAYMNRVNYGGQNYQIMQDGKGGLVAVAHDPSGKITQQMPVNGQNVVPLATSVAQTQLLNILGQQSPDLLMKLYEQNTRQQAADAGTTSAQATWQNSQTQAKDTDAKLSSGLYDAQAGQARASGQASLMSGQAALMNARSMEAYRMAQTDKLQAQIDAQLNKLPEGQKLMFQQLKSNADIASKAALADPQNMQAQVASKSAQLKLARQYAKANLLPAGSEYEFAGIPSPADAAHAITADNPTPADIQRNLTGASVYGTDYANAIKAEIDKMRASAPPQAKQTPGVRRGVPVPGTKIDADIDKLRASRQRPSDESQRTSSGKVTTGQ